MADPQHLGAGAEGGVREYGGVGVWGSGRRVRSSEFRVSAFGGFRVTDN